MDNSKGKKINSQIDLPVLKSGSNTKQPSYWKSYESLKDGDSESLAEKKHNEFPEGADEFDLSKKSPVSRRKFLALMSASSAFAFTACTDYRDKGEIIAYNDKPEEVLPGNPNYYASTLLTGGYGEGILIKTREGRPILIEGNPQHPINQGKINSIGYARILDMYDPGRIEGPQKRSGDKFVDSDWETVDKEIISALKKAANAGKEISIVTNKIVSPTQKKLLEDFKAKYPTAEVYSYELFNDNNRSSAWKKSTGSSNYPLIDLDRASTIISIDCDFLATDGNVNENIRQYASTRNFEKPEDMSRFYAVEASMTLTGSNADYRLRLTPENYLDLLAALANRIASKLGKPTLSGFKSIDELSKENNWREEAVNNLLKDIETNIGKTIVLAGKQLPEEVHIVTNYLNELIGAKALYRNNERDVEIYPVANNRDLRTLSEKVKNGRVGVMVNLDANPAFHFPKELNIKENLSKVDTIISLSEFENETTSHSNFSLGINHDLESWGDAKIRSGVISTQQPVIAPLYETRQKEAVLLNWINEGENYSEDIYHKYLMNNWKNNIYPSLNKALPFKEFWYATLHEGVVKFNETTVTNYEFNTEALSSVRPFKKSNYTVVLQENYFVKDGRFAANGFLQESPHPITKITWDNCAMLSPSTAEELDVEMNDMIEVSLNGSQLELPVVVQPGMADKVVAVDLGYGRENAGPVGTDVGFNAIPLMTISGGISNWIYSGASVKKTGSTYELASVQEHHELDDELLRSEEVKDSDGNVVSGGETFERARNIIQEATVGDYLENPKILKEHQHDVFSITENFEYSSVKWGMNIDMNKCIGCNACNIACYVENNIPVVGKEEVKVGREMGWIRIDRYYAGEPDNPLVSNQPMLCQHCDNAPCENVCPVVATSHSNDGLNQMVYNRCVGTRYCANNCPYKVRRFNFFDFRDHLAQGYYKSDSTKNMMNPEVTIRARGVMEKCTFCVQRISHARQVAKEEGRPLKGSDVTTACQDACPANAIEFGDINNEDSRIAKMRDHDLGYHVLDHLNVRPNVTYVAKLRNTDTLGVVNSEHH